ncbi:MAG: hypothetical protein JSS35_17755 [Proteobacteria bacterium]|nr:hypothetical protein [Pseudomonadota bacterium]
MERRELLTAGATADLTGGAARTLVVGIDLLPTFCHWHAARKVFDLLRSHPSAFNRPPPPGGKIQDQAR